ncbi:NAF domain [Musa troglodytarum]|uniref:non-specific serine/threonine protein kinase n=1 Tax=Musa troglodytarum TaxID=320322 RepID=A0A9E7HAC5_9LILI|nr:NAF domain [Musa troglodytarum]
MGYPTTIGKYHLKRTIGEGTFAKVKLGVDAETNANVAVKIIDKAMVVQNKLMYQVKREISAMKLLNHPNIVKIYEDGIVVQVIATKTKIYLVMEYVAGGQLSDKLEYLKRLDEREARKYFQQLIDAVDYCHSRGVYHRDLKPENLLLDSKGNLKVSDFGLSVLRKPGDLLSTACGSPSYVAPEVCTALVYLRFQYTAESNSIIRLAMGCGRQTVNINAQVIIHKSYDGAAADVWSCGVIIFELLAGYLPFEDRSLMNLYRKISRAEYTCPDWFSDSQKKLISRILDPSPFKRATLSEIIGHEWFRLDCRPCLGHDNDESDSLHSSGVGNRYDLMVLLLLLLLLSCTKASPTHSSLNLLQEATQEVAGKPWRCINAFQLIAMSNDLDLSGLFQEQKTKLGSEHPIDETFAKIEVAAKDVKLSVRRINSSRVRLHDRRRITRSRSHCTLSAEVVEVTPNHCVVEVSKSAGDLGTYKEFCQSLSSLLKDNSGSSSQETLGDGGDDDSDLTATT